MVLFSTPYSVGDFLELTQMFLNHIIASRAPRKIVGSLYSLNQGDFESFKDFILKFNREIARIRNLN